MKKIILASGSPRRKQLLLQIGLEFEVVTGDYDEKIDNEKPDCVVEKLAYGKAYNVLEKLSYPKDCIIIGSDTVVSCDGKILGKPKSKEDAKQTLKLLAGRSHEVYTGVAVLEYADGEVKKSIFHEMAEVEFVDMTDEDIIDYVATGECMDKAGSYAIQGRFAAYVKGIKGDYNAVVGLPVCHLYSELRKFL